MPTLRTYTDAPEEFDYGWARTLIDNVATGRKGPIRLVEHDDEWHMDQQRMRYGSGMFMALSQKEFDDFKDTGMFEVQPEEEQRKHYRKTYEIPYGHEDEEHKRIQAVLDAVEDAPEFKGDFGNRTWTVKLHVVHDVGRYRDLCNVFDKLEAIQKGERQAEELKRASFGLTESIKKV